MIATQVVSNFGRHRLDRLVDGAGDSAQFDYPIGVAMSPDGTYALVADINNHVIRKIVIAKYAGREHLGRHRPDRLADGAGGSAQFYYPIGVAMSPDGTYALVADVGNHVIRKIMIATQVATPSPAPARAAW